MKTQRVGRVLVAAILCLTAVIASAQRYTMVTMGVSGSLQQAGLNNNGEVVGFDNLTSTAFRYTGGVVTPFGPTQLGGIAINDNEQIALNAPTGHAYIWGSISIPQPFPFPPIVIPYFGDIGTLYSGGYAQAKAMNNSGTIVGESWSPTVAKRAFSWSFSTGAMTDLGTLGGISSARAINSAGQIVGQSYNAAGYQRAFQMVNGAMADIDPANPGYDSYATGINNAGQIVVVTNKAWQLVQVSRYKWLWVAYRGSYWYTLLYNSNGTNADIGNLGSTLGTFGLAINNSGDVVGMTNIPSGTSTVQRAFLSHAGAVIDLNTHVINATGWTLLMATNINDYGQIVCMGTGPDGLHQIVLLTPIPD